YYLSLLAGMCGATGQVTEARRLLGDAASALEASDERWWEAEVHRLMGEVALLPSDSSGPEADKERLAEERFEKALRVASNQGAKSLELRAAMSLERLRRRRGGTDGAQPELARIYREFTEGFASADLQE